VAENMQDQAHDDARRFGLVNMLQPISCVVEEIGERVFLILTDVGRSVIASRWRQLRKNPRIFLGIYPILSTINRDLLLHL
jgi:hypothetical protein